MTTITDDLVLVLFDPDTGRGMQRALDALAPAAAELAGAGSGLMTLGPVAAFLDELTQALDR